jgi:hypothetical protein
MKRFLKIISVGLLIIMVLVQFIPRPQKNISKETPISDITKVYPVPDSVYSILKTSCYDCHSNNTNYPWYASVQPLSLWMNHHIEEGKEELNFSEFGKYAKEKQSEKLEEIEEVLKEDEMPLKAYTIVHGEAKLNKEQKEKIETWAHQTRTFLHTAKVNDKQDNP